MKMPMELRNKKKRIRAHGLLKRTAGSTNLSELLFIQVPPTLVTTGLILTRSVDTLSQITKTLTGPRQRAIHGWNSTILPSPTLTLKNSRENASVAKVVKLMMVGDSVVALMVRALTCLSMKDVRRSPLKSWLLRRRPRMNRDLVKKFI